MEVKDRKDIDVKDTWNLESIYANNELWEEDYAALEKDAAEFAKLKGAIEADVSKIPAVLDAYYGLHRRLSKLSVYARMRFDQDTTDSTYQTMSAKIGSLGVKIGAASAFVEPEILSYSKEQLEAAEKENEHGVSTHHAHPAPPHQHLQRRIPRAQRGCLRHPQVLPGERLHLLPLSPADRFRLRRCR